jgi:hypothetical protein
VCGGPRDVFVTGLRAIPRERMVRLRGLERADLTYYKLMTNHPPPALLCSVLCSAVRSSSSAEENPMSNPPTAGAAIAAAVKVFGMEASVAASS